MLLTPITDIYLNKTVKVQLQFLYKSTDLSRISSWGVGEEEEVGKGEKEMSGKPKHCHPYPPPKVQVCEAGQSAHTFKWKSSPQIILQEDSED